MGADIFRMKGVLAIKYADEKFVYQAVHMIFNGNFDESWAEGEPRASKLVFIGKNLNKEELQARFDACKATPEMLQKKVAALRFKIGDKVECNTGGGWEAGEIVDHLYRDDGMPPGMVAPYQVMVAG